MHYSLWGQARFKDKKVFTKNINKCFGKKMYLIMRNTKIIKNKFDTEKFL